VREALGGPDDGRRGVVAQSAGEGVAGAGWCGGGDGVRGGGGGGGVVAAAAAVVVAAAVAAVCGRGRWRERGTAVDAGPLGWWRVSAGAPTTA
jgi:hypothetical protein